MSFTASKTALLTSSIMALSFLSGGSALAHHSFSGTFQEDAKLTKQGVITKFSFKNPHVLTYLDVTNADGTITQWVVEGAAANLLRRGGWTAQTIQPGMRVRATGDSTHDGSPMLTMDIIEVLDANGTVIQNLQRNLLAKTEGESENLGQGTPGASRYVETPLTLPNGQPNISGAWVQGARGDNGRPRRITPVYNAAGERKVANSSFAHDPQVFCDSPGLVRQAGTPHPFRITQYDDRIEFEYEEYGSRRTIPLSQTLPPVDRANTYMGASVASVEGDKIIIRTNNILGHMSSPHGDLLSDETTTVETIYRNDDDISGSVIEYSMVVTDPVYLDGSFEIRKTKGQEADYVMIENDCKPPARLRTVVSDYTSFFVTSEGPGDGANLGGLAGADAHCEVLAAGVGQGGKGWKAYLSTTGEGGVNAKDRIGSGPWYNSRGELVAANLPGLLAADGLTKTTSLSERSAVISGRGDDVNRHDVLTGTKADGTALNNGEDTTCSNWTSNGDGSALVGHHDRIGGGANPTSWTYAHGSRGCGQEALQGTGGDGLYYCFATDFSAPGGRDESALPADVREAIEKSNIAAENAAEPGGMGDGMAAPATDTSAPSGMSGPDAALGADGGGKGWMFILLGLLLAGLGVFVLRRKT